MADLLIVYSVTIFISESVSDSKWVRSEPATLWYSSWSDQNCFIFSLCYNLCLSSRLPVAGYPFHEICFLKRRIKDVLAGSQEVGVTLHQRSAQSCSQYHGKEALIGKKYDHVFLQGHVTTKNPPGLDKSKYSRNGFVVGCTIPTKSKGNF